MAELFYELSWELVDRCVWTIWLLSMNFNVMYFIERCSKPFQNYTWTAKLRYIFSPQFQQHLNDFITQFTLIIGFLSFEKI